ncbi:MAG: hypothetical protein ABL898_18465 [Hyphomicrobiaceae bacterium]
MFRARAAAVLNATLAVAISIGLSMTAAKAQTAAAAITTGSLPPAVVPGLGDATTSVIAARAQQTQARVRAILALAGTSNAVGETKALATEATHLGRRSQAALTAYERLSAMDGKAGKDGKAGADAAKYGAHVAQLDTLLERIELKVRRSNSTLAQNKP